MSTSRTPGGRIRVGHLVWTLRRGGAETLLAQSLGFAHDDFEYSVAYLRPDGTDLVGELEAAGVETVPLGFPHPLKLLTSTLSWLRSLDILHSHAPLPAVAARLASLAIGPRRRVYTEHNLCISYRPVVRVAHALTVSSEKRLIAVSDAVKSAMPPRHQGRTRTIVHGIDAARFTAAMTGDLRVRESLGLSDNELMLLNVANFKDEKDLPNLITAASLVASQNRSVRFVHVGGGKLEDEIKALAASVDPPIVFLGIRDDVPRLMFAADGLVLSSWSEGLPVTVMESQVAGTPYVGTNAGGVPEVIEHGQNGLLVEPRDPQALADAILHFAADSDARKYMSEESLKRSSQFAASTVQEELEAIYRELAS